MADKEGGALHPEDQGELIIVVKRDPADRDEADTFCERRRSKRTAGDQRKSTEDRPKDQAEFAVVPGWF